MPYFLCKLWLRRHTLKLRQFVSISQKCQSFLGIRIILQLLIKLLTQMWAYGLPAEQVLLPVVQVKLGEVVESSSIETPTCVPQYGIALAGGWTWWFLEVPSNLCDSVTPKNGFSAKPLLFRCDLSKTWFTLQSCRLLGALSILHHGGMGLCSLLKGL